KRIMTKGLLSLVGGSRYVVYRLGDQTGPKDYLHQCGNKRLRWLSVTPAISKLGSYTLEAAFCSTRPRCSSKECMPGTVDSFRTSVKDALARFVGDEDGKACSMANAFSCCSPRRCRRCRAWAG